MSRSVRILLEEILESAELIQTYSAGMTFDAFVQDVEKQDAVFRRLK